MKTNRYRCPLDKKEFFTKESLYEHMEKNHSIQLNGMPASRFYFNFVNKKSGGKCVIDSKPTEWNETTERYERFCCDKCKGIYREEFKKRMINSYGKVTLLNEPDHQRKMLAARSISGTYKSDSGYNHDYTGSYEHSFLEFLDLLVGYPPSDVMSPAPQNFEYKDKDETHFYIGDFYLPSIDTIIEIKSHENNHYRERDKHLEKLKEAAVKKAGINFLTIPDNKFGIFVSYLIDLKK